MYKKRVLLGRSTCDSEVFNPFCDDVRIARPLSYYVNGGVDLDGVSDRPPLPAHFDDAESVVDGVVDISTDPRVSKFDILDYASRLAESSSKRAAEKLTGEHVNSD